MLNWDEFWTFISYRDIFIKPESETTEVIPEEEELVFESTYINVFENHKCARYSVKLGEF